MTDTDTVTVTAPAWRIANLQAELDRLARKAAKLGTDAPHVEISPTYTIEDRDADTGVVHHRPVVDVTIHDGGHVALTGWTLVACVEHVPDAATTGTAVNVVTTVGDDTDGIVAAYRTAPADCDHCHTARQRTETFVAREDATGRLVQVGRQCVADFLGHPDALAVVQLVIAYADILGSDDADDDCTSRSPEWTSVLDYATAAQADIAARGYHKASDLHSTKDAAWTILALVGGLGSKDDVEEARKDFTAAAPKAADALAWAIALDPTSDFEQSLHDIATNGVLGRRGAGIAAYIPAAYQRHLEGEVARKAEDDAKAANPSAHVGTIGQRIDVDLTVTRVRAFDGTYGTTYYLAFADDAGNDYLWKTASVWNAEAGDRFVGKATVKAHDTFRGEAQTVLTRCKGDWTHAEEVTAGAA